MNRYSCYLFRDEDVADVKEIAAEIDVKAVLMARAAAAQASYSHFELRQHHRLVRRERCRAVA
jgi:hypothetical protein